MEIKESLFPGENSHDRPDVVTRIFEQKVKELIKDLMKRGVLGKVVAIMLMTEWQKRGEILPNHITLTNTSNSAFLRSKKVPLSLSFVTSILFLFGGKSLGFDLVL